MTFLNPFFLLGLAGTAIPVIIHLLNLRTARRVEFSTLEFLRRVEKKSLRRVRVRQILLLALRMLIIVSVALAMARPALTGPRGGGGRGSVAAAIVLDASLSMRARAGDASVFDEARGRVDSILESLNDGDEVFLLAPGAAASVSAESLHDLGLVRDRLAAVTVGLGAANLDAAVREAGRLLAEARHPNREIHVVSDFQRTGWPEPPAGTPGLVEGIRLFLVPVSLDGAEANAWVESLDHSGQILDTGSPIEIRGVLAAGDGFSAPDLEAELEIDGRTADRRRAAVPEGGRSSVVFRETFQSEGVHSGRLSMSRGGAIAEDDARWFTLRTDRDVPVVVVAGDESSARFLAAAIAPGEAAEPGSFAVRIATSRDLTSLSREREKVVVVADVDRFAEEELAGLKSFLSAGGGLFVFAGPRVDAASWSRQFLPKFVPGRLGDLRVAPPGESFTIAQFDATHSLFEIFRGENGGLSDARFTKALVLIPDAGTSVLATFSNGAAALVESTLLPGRVLFFLSGLDPLWSDFPLTGSFLPFVHESIRHLAEASSQEARSLEVGEGATLWLPSLPEGGGVVLRSPSGVESQVAPQSGSAGYSVELSQTDEPGLWVFRSARGDTLAAYAVNVPASESDLARAPLDEIESRFARSQSVVLDASGDLSRQVREARVGREIGGWFLWAAALFLLLEMVFAGRTPRVAAEGAAP